MFLTLLFCHKKITRRRYRLSRQPSS